MTAPLHTLLDIALRTSIVYLALLAGLRLSGARTLGQMTVFDFVLLLVISNAVQNAMVGADTSLAGGLVAAAVLMLWRWGIARLRFLSRSFARTIAGEGVMLVHDGRLLEAHCRRAGVTIDELRQALREHGVARVEDVLLAVLEPDGAISVIRSDDVAPGSRPPHRIRAMRRG
ncbi:MAG TPA: YetF domain-containing protein [Gemmatimonadales bacterium]|nr:YetF domain-containing protein [Gemmatimonadales bacterium]